MKNRKAIAIMCFVVAGIWLVIGIFHLAGKDFLWGGASMVGAVVFVLLGIRSMSESA